MSDIVIIGYGNIGAKARELQEKTPALKEIGFYVPHRTVLAEDYFDGFFQKNGLGTNLRDAQPTDDLETKIRRGQLTREEFKLLQTTANSYNTSPLVVRSSAEGDSRGTGTYKSEVSENHIGFVRKSLQRVLASYFSPDAIAFRRDANTGEGFGVIVEPLIGQTIDNWCFAPVLSGFGYTSTSRGDGYVNVVAGLGGGVESRDGEQISRQDIERFSGNLRMYIRKKRGEFTHSIIHGDGIKRCSALLGTNGSLMRRGMSNRIDAQAYFPRDQYHKGDVSATSISLERELKEPFDRLNLLPLFDMIGRMEATFGKPQYFEWAMTFSPQGQPVYWITQISDINKKLDILDFDDLGNIIFSAHTITGTGVKECYKIANCWKPIDIPALHEFNQQNQNYVLLFSSKLTTSEAHSRLSYRNFSNATVFVEIQDARHVFENPVAHLGGQLDTTGKFFGVLDFESEPNFDLFRSREKEEHGLRVYQGKLKAIASERQNKMVISALD